MDVLSSCLLDQRGSCICRESPDSEFPDSTLLVAGMVAARSLTTASPSSVEMIATAARPISLASHLAWVPRLFAGAARFLGPLSFIFMASPDELTYEDYLESDEMSEDETAPSETVPSETAPSEQEQLREALRERARVLRLNPTQTRALFIQYGLDPDEPEYFPPSDSQSTVQASADEDAFVEIPFPFFDLIPRALKGEVEMDEPLVLREAQVYGRDFVQWFVANGIHHKMGEPVDGYQLVQVWMTQLILASQSLTDFHHVDWSLLNVDYSENLGIGMGYQNLGFGSQNHGIFRARLEGSSAEVVIKLLPAEAGDYVFREVRNYALISQWGLGPKFYGYTLSPDGEMVGVVMDEVHDGLNTKNLHHFPKFRREAASRFNSTTLEDMRKIRRFLDLFSVHTGDLDFLITPDGHLHLIDPAEFTFFKEKALFPENPDDFDFDNPEALLIRWILEGWVDPRLLPAIEQGKIMEYVMSRYGPDASAHLMRELSARGLNQNK